MLTRIGRITTQMLGFYRGTSRPEPMDVNACLRNVGAVYGQAISAKGIRFERDCELDFPVLGFAEQLRQLISNLIENAIEAVRHNGRIKLRIRFRSDWKNPQRQGLQVVVADNGKGIPLSIRQQIFEPFFTTKGDRGTGLGLWIARGITEKHDGYIRFKSSTVEGRSGSCFLVFLPTVASVHSNRKGAGA